jgi:hypothetical protein
MRGGTPLRLQRRGEGLAGGSCLNSGAFVSEPLNSTLN